MVMAYVCPSVMTEIDKFPGGRLKLLQLLPQLSPCLDTNDPRKLATATALLSSMFFQIPFINCAQAAIYHKDLTEVKSAVYFTFGDLWELYNGPPKFNLKQNKHNRKKFCGPFKLE